MGVLAPISGLFERDLQKLKTEISQYQNEQALWLINKGIANSSGNLCLHIVGNLNAYIGVGLAHSKYVRERGMEFSKKNVPKTTLLNMIDDTIEVVKKGLTDREDTQLRENFPIVVWDKPTKMDYTLIHLSTHLNYHVGQINYHRRMLDANQE